jgi:hypothetical protein
MNGDALSLNHRARFALRGSSLDWRSDLAALLRSDVPIDRHFRDALADAIENKTDYGPRLDLRNMQSQTNRFAAIPARHEWMAIGQWISLLRDQGITNDEAIEKTSEHFNVTEGKCKKALAYFQKAAPIIEAALATEAGEAIGRFYVEGLYHSVFAYPKDTASAQMNAPLLRLLGIPLPKAVGGPASE